MGSESWSQWVPFTKSLTKTFEVAKEEALEELGFDDEKEALEAFDADGTASVLDLSGFVDEPEPGQCWQLTADQLEALFDTTKPTRAAVEDAADQLVEELGRGEALCLVAYANGKPSEVLFAGWSFD